MNHAMKQSFPTLLQKFFIQRLIQQRQASPRTVAAYRDTFRLLLMFAHRQLNKDPSNLTLEDLNVPFILDFLTETLNNSV